MNSKVLSTRSKLGSKGFTLTELMIATTIFSTILLLLTLGLLNIGKNYYKSRNTVRTQEVARRVLDEISSSIQFGDKVPTPIQDDINWTGPLPKPKVLRGFFIDPAIPTSVSTNFNQIDPNAKTIQDYFCIGSKRFSFGNKRVRPPRTEAPADPNEQHGLVVDEPAGGCNKPQALRVDPALGVQGKELLAENTRLTELRIVQDRDNYTITVQVTTGEDEFIERTPGSPQFGTCKAGAGAQYCAVARLETTVQRRRNN